MEEMQDMAEARRREFANLLSQLGDFETLAAVGVIDNDELVERRARYVAFTQALGLIDAGQDVADEQVAGFVAAAREAAAQPTATEELRADMADSQEALAELGVLAADNAVTLDDVLNAVAELGALVESN